MEGKQRIFYSEMKEHAIQINTKCFKKVISTRAFRNSPVLLILCVDQYEQILQLHTKKNPPTQICFKKKKKNWFGVLQLF